MFLFAAVIILLGVYFSVTFTKNQSLKKKYIIWGLVTMFIFTPFVGWFISMSVAIAVGDGFAGVGMMMLLLPIFFITGLILTLIGVFKKRVVTQQID
ncbi:hypothetical protein [Viridibacillus arvi]|uniref:hypothetical protein n=1 Tax=Viridibacillus arvi TaxID=263475 RepID=UPI003D2A1F39